MTLTKIAGVVLAVLLVTTGMAAALPGNAPADSQAGQAEDKYDDAAEDAPDEEADDGLNQSEDARADGDVAVEGPTLDEVDEVDMGSADEADDVPGDVPGVERPDEAADGANVSDQGPPVALPEQVPDFVSEIHQQIREYKLGDFTGDLGDVISDLTPGDAADGNESQQEMPDGAPQGAGPA
jgi:hypothetical protein